MKHILQRHHPEYLDSSVKVKQSFLDSKMSIDDVQGAVSSVLNHNRNVLTTKGTKGMYQTTGSYNGVEYVLGLNNGRVGQFFPLWVYIMISVRTYIKKEEEFIEFHSYTGHIEDSNYIEGALELTINGITLLDKDMWDYIDQLWSYIVDGIVCILNDQPFESYFPDQPIKISFVPMKGNVSLSVMCNSEKTIQINKKKFIHVMSKHVIDFFDYLRKKDSIFNNRYNELFSILDKC